MVRAAKDQAAAGPGGGGPASVAEDAVTRVGAAELEQITLDQLEDQGKQEPLWFCAFVGVSVFLNVQVVALETDYGCAHFDCSIEDRLPWVIFDHLFTVLFLVDVAFTVQHAGPARYLCGEPGRGALRLRVFNCLDLVIVLLRVVDVWGLGLAGIETGLKLVSLLRVVHVTRFVRRLQLVPAFRELWLIVVGMRDTVKAVAIVAVLLVLLLWVFATLVTIAVMTAGEGTHFDFRASSWAKEDYWGDVPKSMYSLFQVFTGDKWSESLAWPLIKRYPGLVVLFVAFRVAAGLALMNTIVGSIVETTLSSARANEEALEKDRKRREAVVMESLREIFREADADESGELDREELAAMVKTRAVRDRMVMLGIPVAELEQLHGLLDTRGGGRVDTDAFFRGCSRLRGAAMAVDLQQMSVDLDRHGAAAEAHLGRAEAANDALAALLDCIEGVDVDVVRGDKDEKDPVLMARRGRPREPKAQVFRSASRVDGSPPALIVEPPASRSQQTSKERMPSRRPAEEPAPPWHGAYERPEVTPPPPPLPGALPSRYANGA